MIKLKRIYRENYAGENIITELDLSSEDRNCVTEYVPNSIENSYTTSQAVAIGNGTTRLVFDMRHIARHKGGLFGVNRLQSYGCNALYRDFTPDFLVATGDAIIEEIVNSGYTDQNIVYAHVESVTKFPGHFYLIPQNIYIDSGALAAYMACFDGHKKVFLLGYDQYDCLSATNNVYVNTPGYPTSNEKDNGEFLSMSLAEVVSTYSEVEFVRVMPEDTWWVHPRFKSLPNFRQINYGKFVIEADIG